MTRHLISTKVTEIRCQHCRQLVLRALDEGVPTRIDPTPIANETTALLAGLLTYTLTPQHEIVHRDASRIRGSLAGTIHTEHQCPKGGK